MIAGVAALLAACAGSNTIPSPRRDQGPAADLPVFDSQSWLTDTNVAFQTCAATCGVLQARRQLRARREPHPLRAGRWALQGLYGRGAVLRRQALSGLPADLYRQDLRRERRLRGHLRRGLGLLHARLHGQDLRRRRRLRRHMRGRLRLLRTEL